MLGNSSPKFTISLLLLIVSIVFVFAEEMIEESGDFLPFMFVKIYDISKISHVRFHVIAGWIDFNHPKWSSTKFSLRDSPGNLDSSQILHRVIQVFSLWLQILVCQKFYQENWCPIHVIPFYFFCYLFVTHLYFCFHKSENVTCIQQKSSLDLKNMTMWVR